MCQDCGRAQPSAQPSLEFDAVICDGCYGLRLADKEQQRHRTVSANTAAHWEAIRAARDISLRPPTLGV